MTASPLRDLAPNLPEEAYRGSKPARKSTLVATLTTELPTDADMFITLPVLSRSPYLFDDWDERLRHYIMASLQAGLVTLSNSSAPNFITKEVLELACESLEALNLNADQITFRRYNYVRFDEERMVARVPRYEAHVDAAIDKIKVYSEDPKVQFMVVNTKGLSSYDDLHKRLASDGLHGLSPDVKLFNADYIGDSREYERADRLTSALHDALDRLDIEKLRRGDSQVMIFFTKA